VDSTSVRGDRTSFRGGPHFLQDETALPSEGTALPSGETALPSEGTALPSGETARPAGVVSLHSEWTALL